MRQFATDERWNWGAFLLSLGVALTIWLSATVSTGQPASGITLKAKRPIAGDTSTVSHRIFEFAESGVVFHADFNGARLNDVVRESDTKYRALIRPENEPINDSAWYAFRVTATDCTQITIDLTYQGGTHRYHPKISVDGKNWRKLSGDRYQHSKDKTALRINVGPQPTWIAAQEMIGVTELNEWTDKLAQVPFVSESVVGRSVAGRPIRQLTVREGEPKFAVAIVGRQHPPEVTGSLALMAFVKTLTEQTAAAEQFRHSFETIVIPLANPDGVAAGNWRHNLHGVDLNRDWGPFRQPETRAIRDSILRLQLKETPRLALFLDFHSTQNDIFYIQSGSTPVWPTDFGNVWLDALATRMPDYRIRRESEAGVKPLSKVWARKAMTVPAIIYEVGDETNRALIKTVAQNAAKEMMRLLLEEVASSD